MIDIFVAAWEADAALEDFLSKIAAVRALPAVPSFTVVVAFDMTEEAAAQAAADLSTWTFPIRAFAAARHRGAGAALKSALPSLQGDKVFFIPSAPEATLSLLKACLLHHDEADAVLCFPINVEARNIVRTIGSFAFRMLYLVSFGTGINAMNGTGLYPVAVLRQLKLRGNRFALLSEINTRILRTAATYCEIPYSIETDRRFWRGLKIADLIDLLRSYLTMLVELRLSGEAAPIGPDHEARLRCLPPKLAPHLDRPATGDATDANLLSFIVPALNEEENLDATFATILKSCGPFAHLRYEIIIVNDGSTDRTGPIADALAERHPGLVRVVHHAVNRGVGASVSDGVAVCKGDRFIWVAGDNQMSSETLVVLLRFDRTAEIVLSFPSNIVARGILRNLISQIYLLAYLVGCGCYLNYVNGSGIYPVALFDDMQIRGRRFSLLAEMHAKMIRSGASFIEVPGYANPTAEANRRVLRAVNPRNVAESVLRFACVVWELAISRRWRFNHRPRRLLMDF
jgi:dolichol-phosphate mannosyltransferase